MHSTDRDRDMSAALARVDIRAERHRGQLQHQAIISVFGDVLTGLPHLRWTRPHGHGAAGIIGQPFRGSHTEQLQAISVYILEYGYKRMRIMSHDGGWRAESDVILVGVPVTVAAPVWSRGDSHLRPRRSTITNRIQASLDELGSPIEVRRLPDEEDSQTA